jgi:SHS2 domain-containing protein
MDKKEAMSAGASRAAAPTERERTPFGTIEIRVHTTDLTVEMRGHSAADLFRLGAWTLARLQVAEWPTEGSVKDMIEIESDGWDDLLVNWMNQLLFLSEKHRAMWNEIEFSRLEETGLAAVVKGLPWPERPEQLGREIKSTSYSGLELIPGPSLWLARVTLDL